jgi:hypothetical protein
MYRTISSLGSVNTPDPVNMCLHEDYTAAFVNGGDWDARGPRSTPCQLYMAERCAANWDEACDAYYCKFQSQVRSNFPPASLVVGDGCNRLSLGDNLLRNTAILRFFDILGCEHVTYPLTDIPAQSPTYTIRYNRGNKVTVQPKKIKYAELVNDPLYKRMKRRPDLVGDILKIIDQQM